MPTLKQKPHESNGHDETSSARQSETSAARFRSQGGPAADLVLAHDPNLIVRIQADIAALGVVGEEDNALLVYLIYTSRLLSEPGAVVTRAPSSVGKSHLLNTVAEPFPPEEKIEAMRFTEASLFNTDEDYFRHKILISGERKHSQDDIVRDQNAMIRQLLSEKKISRNVSVPGGEGQGRWVTENVTRHGPIVYAESTTATSIFEEDLNRMLQLYLDESSEQTQKIMLAKAARYDPDRAKEDVSAIIERHHEFQRSLQSWDVRIPFWEKLAKAIPSKKVESRRVIQQVLTVIEAIVLLHQYQREQRDGCLLATLDDYALARRLLLAPIHASLGIGKDFKKAEPLRAKITTPTFTTTDVRIALNYKSKMGPHHLMTALMEAGLVNRLSKGKGSLPAKYEWMPGVEWEVLPTAECLAGN